MIRQVQNLRPPQPRKAAGNYILECTEMPSYDANRQAGAALTVPSSCADDEIAITLGMAEAGGRVAQALLADPSFLAKPNAPGEFAGRVFRAMRAAEKVQC
jgi:hypothetical protein